MHVKNIVLAITKPFGDGNDDNNKKLLWKQNDDAIFYLQNNKQKNDAKWQSNKAKINNKK